MQDLDVRPVTPLNLPELATPCLKSGALVGKITIPVERGEALARGKLAFFHERRTSGAGAQIAYSGNRAVGLIEYCPIELAPVPLTGDDLFVILCMTVTTRERAEEIEKALVDAARADWSARSGVIVLGHERDWTHHGFEAIWRDFWPDGRDLTLWMLRLGEAEDPEPVPLGVRGVTPPGGKVLVQIFDPGCCPWITYVADRVVEVAASLGPRVEVEIVDTGVRENVLRYGLMAGVAINGRIQKWLRPHPIPPEEEIREKIELYL
jgi:hypothetical protein